jgi:hypothetical protein
MSLPTTNVIGFMASSLVACLLIPTVGFSRPHGLSNDCGQGPARSGEWPTILPGTWELVSARTLPSGKVQRWTEQVNHCVDAADFFRGYWGLGILEEAGCRYDAAKSSATEFRITSECMVRRAGKVGSTALVTVTSAEAFTMQVNVSEGKRKYRGTQVGHRIAGCANVPEGRRGRGR